MIIKKDCLKNKLLNENRYLYHSIDRLDKILDCIYSLDSSFHELIVNLKSNNRKIIDFLVEANIIYEIIESLSKNNVEYPIKYEQKTEKGKPDLKIELNNDIIIWVQLKCFGISEIDNKRLKAIALLKCKLAILYNHYFDIKTTYRLTETNVEKFIIKLKKEKLPTSCSFECKNQKISIKQNERKDFFEHNHGIFTDEFKKQTTESFKTAQQALPQNSEKIINIIICQNIYNDIDKIDIGNAIYGTDGVKYTNHGEYWVRSENGLIHEKQNTMNINYYLSYESNHYILGKCNKHLFVIKENAIVDISKFFDVDKRFIYYEDTYIP